MHTRTCTECEKIRKITSLAASAHHVTVFPPQSDSLPTVCSTDQVVTANLQKRQCTAAAYSSFGGFLHPDWRGSNRPKHGKPWEQALPVHCFSSPLLKSIVFLKLASPQGLFPYLATDSLLRQNIKAQQSIFFWLKYPVRIYQLIPAQTPFLSLSISP